MKGHSHNRLWPLKNRRRRQHVYRGRQNSLIAALETLECRCLLSAPTPSTILPAPIDRFELFVDEQLTQSGLTGSYVDSSLRSVTAQDDWRNTQTIVGSRIDPAIDFGTSDWGVRSTVGVTGGTDPNWDNFSVQWDGFIRVVNGDTQVQMASDDGSRFWIDLDGDGEFNASGPEFVDNGWGTSQSDTVISEPLDAGVYQIRVQYEEGTAENLMRLQTAEQPVVRVAYLIPSNRSPRDSVFENLPYMIRTYQDWVRDQMSRHGFGEKTFAFEADRDGDPLVHVLRMRSTDDYYRADNAGNGRNVIYSRVLEGARAAGIDPFADGEIWLLVHEAHLMNPDGSILGGIALGQGVARGGDAGGVGVVSSVKATFMNPDGLRNDLPYDGQIVPEIGPFALRQGVSFPWFEGTTFSSVTSSGMGAYIHELFHGFGLPHDFRLDGNFRGNLMGNGLRGFRNVVHPELYPDDLTRFSRASAVALNSSPFLSPTVTSTDSTIPTITVSPSTPVVNGLLEVSFTADDDVQLGSAVLLVGGKLVAEMELSGMSVSETLSTPLFTPDEATNIRVVLRDAAGNKTFSQISSTPTVSGNRAPQPTFRANRETIDAGGVILLDAFRSTDPDGSSLDLTYEWDLDGDGLFEVPPSSNSRFTLPVPEAGTRLIQVRVTDAAGDSAVSMSMPVRVQDVSDPAVVLQGGDYEVLRDSDDLVVRNAGSVGTELFRRDASELSTLVLQGSSFGENVTVLNSGTVVDTPIYFSGAAGDDRFNGVQSGAATTLFGGPGNDTLSGGIRDDRISGEDGNDNLFAGNGRDHVSGGPGNDRMFGSSGYDTLVGGGGDDFLRGGQGRDLLTGNEGDDVLFGDEHNDMLAGGDGNDTVSGGLGDDTLLGAQGQDHLEGDAGRDSISGGAENDTVSGGNGYDTISGGRGNDSIRGGRGQDRLIGDEGHDSILGDEQNDTLIGGDGNDTLRTGPGRDRVFGGAGHDRIDGGPDDNQLYGDAGNDTISGSTGRDLIRGGADDDQLAGAEGFDTLFGDRGNDTIMGGDGNDTVYGGPGRDSVSGGAGNDRLFGNNGYDKISGGSGNDFLRGGPGRDSLAGDVGNDELIGDEHNDLLTGGSGSDRATGGTGADTIDVQEAPQPDGIDSVIGSDMTDTVFKDPADLLI